VVLLWCLVGVRLRCPVVRSSLVVVLLWCLVGVPLRCRVPVPLTCLVAVLPRCPAGARPRSCGAPGRLPCPSGGPARSRHPGGLSPLRLSALWPYPIGPYPMVLPFVRR